MERFSSAALSKICDEVALQGHLLSRGYLVEVAERTDADDVIAVGIEQAAGVAGVTAKRLGGAARRRAGPRRPGRGARRPPDAAAPRLRRPAASSRRTTRSRSPSSPGPASTRTTA